jgi:hypothetical protein
MVAVETCCDPEPEEHDPGRLMSIQDLTSDDPIHTPWTSDTINIAITDSLLAVVSADGTLQLGSLETGSYRAFEIDAIVVDVGL